MIKITSTGNQFKPDESTEDGEGEEEVVQEEEIGENKDRMSPSKWLVHNRHTLAKLVEQGQAHVHTYLPQQCWRQLMDQISFENI